MPTTTIVIAGISGKLGRLISAHLLAKSGVRINGLCRTPGKVPASIASNPAVKLYETDGSSIDKVRAALKRADVCICCYLGDDEFMIKSQRILIDACIAEKVPRYIASDFGPDYRGLKYGDFPSEVQMKTREYLNEKETTGLIKGVNILNGIFMEVWWSSLRPFEVREPTFRYWGTGDEKIEVTTYDDVARYTAEVALDKDANGFLCFLGDRKSIKAIVAEFQEVYHEIPEMQRLGSLDDLFQKMTATWDQNPGNQMSWVAMCYTYYMLNGQTHLDHVDNERYPHIRPVNFRTFMMNHTLEGLVSSSKF